MKITVVSDLTGSDSVTGVTKRRNACCIHQQTSELFNLILSLSVWRCLSHVQMSDLALVTCINEINQFALLALQEHGYREMNYLSV